MEDFSLTNYAYSVTLSVSLAVVLWVYRVEFVTIRDWLLKHTGINRCRRTINEGIYRNIYRSVDVRDGKSFKVRTDVSYNVTEKRQSRTSEAVIMTLFLPMAVIQYIITVLYVTVEHGNSFARQAEKSIDRRRVEEILAKPSNRSYWPLKLGRLSESELDISSNVDSGHEADCILHYKSTKALTCAVVKDVIDETIDFAKITQSCEKIIKLYGNDADKYEMPHEETTNKLIANLFEMPKNRGQNAQSRLIELTAGKDMSLLLVDKQNDRAYFTLGSAVSNIFWTNMHRVFWNMESLMEYDDSGKIHVNRRVKRYGYTRLYLLIYFNRVGWNSQEMLESRCVDMMIQNDAVDVVSTLQMIEAEGLKVETCDSVNWLPRNETNDFSENVKLGRPCMISKTIVYDGYKIRAYSDGEECLSKLVPAIAIMAGSLSIGNLSEILDRVSGTLNDSDRLRACLYGSMLSRDYRTNVLGDKISWAVAMTNAFRFGLTNKPGRAYRRSIDRDNDGGATVISFTYNESAETLLDGDMCEIARRNRTKADLTLDINVGGTVSAANCVRMCGEAYTYEPGEEEDVVRLIIKRKECRMESRNYMTYG